MTLTFELRVGEATSLLATTSILYSSEYSASTIATRYSSPEVSFTMNALLLGVTSAMAKNTSALAPISLS